MNKVYKFNRKFYWIIPLILIVPIGIIFFQVANEQNLWNHPVIFCLVALILLMFILYPIISVFTGRLELGNDVLSRKYFFIEIWSVAVSDLTDIVRGNSVRKFPVQDIGLTFKDKNSKFYEAPYIIPEQESLIKDLLAINSNLEYHTNPADLRAIFGWKGNTGFKKFLVIMVVILIIGVLAAKFILPKFFSRFIQ